MALGVSITGVFTFPPIAMENVLLASYAMQATDSVTSTTAKRRSNAVRRANVLLDDRFFFNAYFLVATLS